MREGKTLLALESQQAPTETEEALCKKMKKGGEEKFSGEKEKEKPL